MIEVALAAAAVVLVAALVAAVEESDQWVAVVVCHRRDLASRPCAVSLAAILCRPCPASTDNATNDRHVQLLVRCADADDYQTRNV